eukprot:2160838-Rhodomonas_salina.2
MWPDQYLEKSFGDLQAPPIAFIIKCTKIAHVGALPRKEVGIPYASSTSTTIISNGYANFSSSTGVQL